jgi:L-asparaginase/Glu-tRNA(Gln) amidotransferase subunit D
LPTIAVLSAGGTIASKQDAVKGTICQLSLEKIGFGGAG